MTKTQNHNEKAKIAEQEAKRAEHHAETARALAGRHRVHIKALNHKANVATEMLETSSKKANTEPEALAKRLAAENLATAKNRQAIALKEEADNFTIIASLRKQEAKVAKTTYEKELAVSKAQEAESKAAEKESEAKKMKLEARQASSEAKKAQLETKEAVAAKELVIKHTKNLAEAEAELKIIKAEFEMREAEAKARSAQAQAKMAEAKALKKGDLKAAENHRVEAKLHQTEAIAKSDEVKALKNSFKSKKKDVVPASPAPATQFPPKRRARCEEKKHLSANGLLNRVHELFKEIPDSNNKKLQSKISQTDCLMSALAMFSLKYPSLLQFENDSREEGPIEHNLKTLYKVKQVPSDTYMRERLDEVDPAYIRPAFKKLFADFQRDKGLEEYLFLDNYYLMSGDGTGFFSSNTIHCDDCCSKCHKDGHCTYYHQMMTAAIVHPDHATVIPFCPEPITNQDGSVKNDCERNASERLYRHIRREHPHLPLIVTEDALGSNGPHIRMLKELNMRFILVVKSEGNKSLFEFLNGVQFTEYEYKEGIYTYKIRFINNIPLNDSNHDLDVNFFELFVYDNYENLEYHNSWITDILITKQNVYRLCQGGRAKWKIENETFNTLKNQGYNFEHNFGHGFKHLSTVFALLMFLAFFIDQIQQCSCGLFQTALEKMKSKVRLWGRMRAYFSTLFIDTWEQFFRGIAFGIKEGWLTPKINTEDTS